MAPLETGTIRANDVDFAYLAAGPADGPLALCLHGFPDTAHTYRFLVPALAGAGYRAVAPFMRGYAPTSVPADGRYQTGALGLDAIELHGALGGGADAVLVGHDWGASAAYTAAAHAPDRWRKVVTLAVPPAPAIAAAFLRYEQLKRSFYMFFFQLPLADVVVPMAEHAFIAGLWADWSPGFDATEDVAHVRAALGSPENLGAALGYYRAMFDPSRHADALADVQSSANRVPPQPTLYLHGAQDGCIGVEVGRAADGLLSQGSSVVILDGVGHFLHLERPDELNRLILDFLGQP